jgi:hypothetical protein
VAAQLSASQEALRSMQLVSCSHSLDMKVDSDNLRFVLVDIGHIRMEGNNSRLKVVSFEHPVPHTIRGSSFRGFSIVIPRGTHSGAR